LVLSYWLAGFPNLYRDFCRTEQDNQTGASAGYGFVKFQDARCADLACRWLNGKMFCSQELRVNWAFQSHQREDTSNHIHIFVGDIGQEVTDSVLLHAFAPLAGCS
jgi:nucleolysin TIA-1/TIAR